MYEKKVNWTDDILAKEIIMCLASILYIYFGLILYWIDLLLLLAMQEKSSPEVSEIT